MPRAPRSPCRQPGCKELVDKPSYCEAHRKARNRQYSQDRRNAGDEHQAFYTSSRWRKLRAWHLREHPLCCECERRGRTVIATIVDHITLIKQGGAPLERTNLQSLCGPCHSRKSALEGSRWGVGGIEFLGPGGPTSVCGRFCVHPRNEGGGYQ